MLLLGLYDRLRASDEAVAKALSLSEVSRIARIERRVRELLLAAWTKHAREAAAAAAAKARGGANAKAVAAAVEREMWEWSKVVIPKLQAEMDAIYRLAREAGWKKATGQTNATLTYDTPNLTEILKKAPKAGFAVKPTFDLLDRNAMDAMQNHHVFWVGEHYSKNLGTAIGASTQAALLEAGRDLKTAGKLVESAVRRELGRVVTPGGFSGTPAQYFEGLAANAATTARAFGQMSSFIRVGAVRYEIKNPLDSRTCQVCKAMDGKTFTVREGAETMANVMSADSSDAVKEAQPWLSAKDIAGKSDADLSKAGFNLPPFHFRCRCAVDVDPSAGFTVPMDPPAPPKPPPPIKVPAKPPQAPIKLPPGFLPTAPPPPPPGTRYPVTQATRAVLPTRGKADEAALKKAFAPLAEGTSPTAAQAQRIRKELNELVEEFGMHNQDLARSLPAAGQLTVRKNIGGAMGSHFTNTALIQIRQSEAKLAQAFFTKGSRALPAKRAAQTFVHEAVHGTNPMAPGLYRGSMNKWLVEVSTEAASRQMMVERFGLRFVDGNGYMGWMEQARNFMKQSWKKTAKAFKANAGTLTAAEADEALGKAAIRLMRHAKRYRTGDEYGRAFFGEIQWPERMFTGMSAQQKAAATKDLVEEMILRWGTRT